MQITLKDIARMAGVAESTVSRALNDKKGVGENTRKKIIEIAEKYDYRPNKLARGLVSKKTNMIALILSDMENQSYIDIVKNIEIEAEKNNISETLSTPITNLVINGASVTNNAGKNISVMPTAAALAANIASGT